ncbi:hypothetical protein Q5752_001125 [Cryptotrichosporon argae]
MNHPATSDVSATVDRAATPASAATLMDGAPVRREISIQDQSARLPFRRILVIYFAIGLALIVSFMDQTSVSTAAPEIGTDLNGSATISWVGTAYFVSNCAFQLVYGRLSDIVGRKTMLQVATCLLVVGNVACSFAQTPAQLYGFRAVSGAGGGGINNMAMTIVSDIVPLKDRGKYQGLISAATAVGNAVGPFVGGGLASAGQWRWLFRVTAILGAIVIVLDYLILPLKPVTGSARAKLAKIDYAGIALSAAATVFLLVPISGGGSTFAWDSATVVACLVLGGIAAVAFTVYEWKVARLPILPMRIFETRTSMAVMFTSFFIGMTNYSNAYYLPTYLQYAKGYSALVSGAVVLACTFPSAPWGILGGFYISKTNHYKRVIVAGAVLCTLGIGLQIMWTPHTSLGAVIGCLEVTAIGTGWSLQTTLVAALATTRSEDRAVVTAGRNFFRTLGGAFGLAISNLVYQTTVQRRLTLNPTLTSSDRTALLSSALSLPALGLSAHAVADVRAAFADAIRVVFICFTAWSSVCVLCALVMQEVVFRRDSPELEAERRRARGKDAEEPAEGDEGEGTRAETESKGEEEGDSALAPGEGMAELKVADAADVALGTDVQSEKL